MLLCTYLRRVWFLFLKYISSILNFVHVKSVVFKYRIINYFPLVLSFFYLSYHVFIVVSYLSYYFYLLFFIALCFILLYYFTFLEGLKPICLSSFCLPKAGLTQTAGQIWPNSTQEPRSQQACTDHVWPKQQPAWPFLLLRQGTHAYCPSTPSDYGPFLSSSLAGPHARSFQCPAAPATTRHRQPHCMHRPGHAPASVYRLVTSPSWPFLFSFVFYPMHASTILFYSLQTCKCLQSTFPSSPCANG